MRQHEKRLDNQPGRALRLHLCTLARFVHWQFSPSGREQYSSVQLIEWTNKFGIVQMPLTATQSAENGVQMRLRGH